MDLHIRKNQPRILKGRAAGVTFPLQPKLN